LSYYFPAAVAVKGYEKRTEQRRLTRIAERHADTVCFACREKGHAAKDCPKAVGEGGDDDGQKNINKVVGMCYRFVTLAQNVLCITERCVDVAQRNTHCLAARHPKILTIPSLSLHVLSVQEKVTLLHPVHKTKKRGYTPTGDVASYAVREPILPKIADFERKTSRGRLRGLSLGLEMGLVRMRMISTFSSGGMQKCRKARRKRDERENGSM
jgi:hypothetical protein